MIDSWFSVETDLVQNLSNWTNMSKLVFSTLVVLSLLHQMLHCHDWVTDCSVWVVWVVEAECVVEE